MPNIDWVNEPDAPHRRCIRLARPARRNAIDMAMLLAIREALAVWENDPVITEVCIASAVPGVFSAGGDIAAYVGAGALAADYQRRFLDDEYGLLADIRASRLHTVCHMDGLAMGGGLGLAMACSRRQIAGGASFAMPELAIGLIPDVGASGFLAHPSPGHGLAMALGGYRVTAGEAVRWGWGEATGGSEAAADSAGPVIDQLADDLAAFGNPYDAFAHLERVLPEGDAARIFAGRSSALAAATFCFLMNDPRTPALDYPQRLAVEKDLVGKLTDAGEFPEGIAAFLAKRDADFAFGTLGRPQDSERCLALARQWVADALGQAA